GEHNLFSIWRNLWIAYPYGGDQVVDGHRPLCLSERRRRQNNRDRYNRNAPHNTALLHSSAVYMTNADPRSPTIKGGNSRMKTTASDVLIDAIHDWGVDVVFGMPGDGINGIMEALRKRADKIRFIQVRHEEAAAFMACAYAKYTGRLGVCLATSGPGGLPRL